MVDDAAVSNLTGSEVVTAQRLRHQGAAEPAEIQVGDF
jgi:hypothetical protein